MACILQGSRYLQILLSSLAQFMNKYHRAPLLEYGKFVNAKSISEIQLEFFLDRLGTAYFDTESNAMFVLETWEHGNEEFPSVQLSKWTLYHINKPS